MQGGPLLGAGAWPSLLEPDTFAWIGYQFFKGSTSILFGFA